MFSNGFFVLIFVFITTSVSWSQNSEPEISEIFLLCKREKSVRWLRAYKLENGKCKTLYSKEGYLQVISSATYFSSCEGVLQSVQKNIEEGGFKCVNTAQVSVLELE
ncbi:MAG: hypothetical protein H7061_04335 [Bdellovibrionaceae bacterium]|nr:hypothetical protein [Bdellovibrio sp.]